MFPLEEGDLRGRSVPQGLKARLFLGLSEEDRERSCFRRVIKRAVEQFPEILARTKEYAETHGEFPIVKVE